ncbi:MAG: chemotaxis protein CheA [Mycobacteriales bacterium]|nr:chemotaxis protein CheA [Mycobacteriales bacterium]
MNESNDEVVQEFLVESYENLDRLDQDLVALERTPDDTATLSSIFRTIHTIKGTCGFLGFSKLEAVAHVGENLLSKLRDHELTFDADITSGLLQMVDAVRGILASIETTAEEGDGDYSALVAELGRLCSPPEARLAVVAAPAGAPAGAPVDAPVDMAPAATGTDDETARLGDILLARHEVEPDDIARAVQAQEDGDLRPLGQLLIEEGTLQPRDLADALHAQAEARSHVSDQSIRVDVALLDKLMNLVGELVLARNRVLQFTRADSEPDFITTSQRLNLVTSELQEGVMKTRMQPVGTVWSKFPRVVRDLSHQLGKQVRIEMEGEETELDKTIIEAIKDPLTHIVRNSVDHGIESPEARVAAGKPAEGTLLLRAFHEGGQVNIEITDDGAGINLERVRSRAVERNLLSVDQAARMSDREIANLIFLPGFSTAAAVTNVSGRGVGMDVVKTSIEKIGGTVDLQPRPGQGTTLRIRIPLTLAIIPALIVVTGGDRYAIPQVNLLELVRLEGEQARTAVEMIHDTPVYRLRGNLLPLVDLRHELGLGDREEAGDVMNIVVLQADDRQFGLVVEGVSDTEEIVVKPLGRQLKGIATFAGATIMGDGRLALILDVLGLAQQAKVVSENRERAALSSAASAAAGDEAAQALVVLRLGLDTRVAVPLSLVARLEEVPASSVERSGGRDVVQYRGQIMPLVHVCDALGVPRSVEEHEVLQVVVHSVDGRNVGLVVDEIVDIVEEHLVIERVGSRRGMLGSAILQGRVTDLLDVAAVVGDAVPAPLAIGA